MHVVLQAYVHVILQAHVHVVLQSFILPCYGKQFMMLIGLPSSDVSAVYLIESLREGRLAPSSNQRKANVSYIKWWVVHS